MDMEGKKISFGFKKVQRGADARLTAPTVRPAPDEKIHYIDCVEDNAIKVVGGEVVEEKAQLVIPVKPNTLSTDRFLEIADEVEPNLDDATEEQKDTVKDKEVDNETLEQQAARELMEEAQNIQKVETQDVTVPLPIVQPLSGKKEPTLEDYEDIPIADYGMAMLRGMGWTPGQKSKYIPPVMRPRGLGLGADKLVKRDAAKKNSGGKRDEEELELKNNCCVRVIAGKYAGCYGKVISINEESARATVELALGHDQVEIGEQLLQPVTRKVYDDRSRVLNSDKYDEYKKNQGLANETPSLTMKSNDSICRPEDIQNNSKRKIKRDSSNDEDMGNEKTHGQSTSRNLKKRDDSKQNYSRGHSSNGTDKHKSENKRDSRETVKKPISSENKRSQNDNVRKPSRDSSSFEEDSMREVKSSHHDFIDEEERIGHKSRKEQRAISSSSSGDNRVRRKHKSKSQHKQKDRISSCSSKDSLSSISSGDRKRSNKSKKKKSATTVGKREIDKKRKGKKKKRDRDRSPHRRKRKY